MATNLTGSTIASTYDQLLHMDGGPAATEKSVLSGVGVVTALKLGTTSASVGNVQVSGNTISTLNTNGDLTFAPNGTGAVVIPKVAITSGSISGITWSGDVVGSTLLEGATVATSNAAAGVNLNGNTLAADGTDTNIDINITPKGTGEVNVTNIDVISGKVPYNVITNRAYGQFYSTQDQTAAASTPTAVTFNNSEAFNAGVSVVSNSRITFAAAGDYDVYFNVQLANAENADHEVTFWLKLNGSDITASATRIVVPASGVGGTGFFAFNTILRVTAGQYVEVYWAPEDADVSLSYEAAEPSTPFARPAIPSVVLNATRVG